MQVIAPCLKNLHKSEYSKPETLVRPGLSKEVSLPAYSAGISSLGAWGKARAMVLLLRSGRRARSCGGHYEVGYAKA